MDPLARLYNSQLKHFPYFNGSFRANLLPFKLMLGQSYSYSLVNKNENIYMYIATLVT